MSDPVSEADVVRLVCDAASTGRPIHVVGSRTKLTHGPGGLDGAAMFSLRSLDEISSYEPDDLVVSVEAGARLADLQAELGRHSQWLPIDAPYPDATIGGILATNSSGPRRLGYGTMRDHLIGLRVVGSDGVVTRSGGRVVKNVTGYDLHKLHIGAFGTLGVITQANFKVRPLPPVSAAIAFDLDSFEAAHEFLLRVHALPLRPVALEAVEARAIVGVEGTRAAVDRHVRDLGSLGRAFEVIEGDAVWRELRELPAGSVRIRIGARPHDLPRLVPPGRHRRAHAGNGIARVDLEPASDLTARLAEWRSRAEALGGYLVVESAPLELPGRAALPWGGPPDPADALMRAIREARDPARILNPGRMPA